MEKENNVTPITESPAEQATEEVSLTVKFSKPYRFEDKTYKEIDLSGLDNLTAEDMIAADQQGNRPPRGVLQTAVPQRCHQDQEQGDQFFLRRGIRAGNGKQLRKICLELSLSLRTGVDYFLRLSLWELTDTAKEAADTIGKWRKRIPTGYKNRR